MVRVFCESASFSLRDVTTENDADTQMAPRCRAKLYPWLVGVVFPKDSKGTLSANTLSDRTRVFGTGL